MCTKLIRFCNYNCRGWRSGSDCVATLLKSVDLCFIQEHWLLPEHLGALDISDDFISIGVSGMDSSELLAGRPYGGCGILYRKSLSQSISRLRCCSKRFCALTLTLTNPITSSTFNTLLFNVYLPTDYNTCGSNNAFLETVAELDGFISSQLYDNIIICGDFNVDFSRGGHNFRHLDSFMCEHGLVSADRNSSIKYI